MLSDAPTAGKTESEYRLTTAMRRGRALDALRVELHKRSFSAHLVPLPESQVMPTLSVCNARTFHPRGLVEVRVGLGNCDWFGWQDGADIVQADLPTVAAVEIAEAL